jgi:hypothetical protein
LGELEGYERGEGRAARVVLGIALDGGGDNDDTLHTDSQKILFYKK